MMLDKLVCQRAAPRLALICCSLTLLACSGPPASAPVTEAAGLRLSPAAMHFIEVRTLAEESGDDALVLPGRLAFGPQGRTAVAAPVAGRVTHLALRPGQTVKAGTPLLSLQSAEAAAARAGVEQAAARAAAAEDLLRRETELSGKGVGVEVDRFAAETGAREARAELARAQREAAFLGAGQADQIVLKAPADGVVLTVRAQLGAAVSPDGEALVEIGDPRALWVVAEAPESAVAALKLGQLARIAVPAADAVFETQVAALGSEIDAENRRLPVYLSLPAGGSAGLAQGMQAEVRLSGASGKAFVLPVAAVLIKDGDKRVVYLQQGEDGFEAREVRTGASRDGKVTVVDGLQAGDRVVVRGALLLDGEAEQLL